VKSVAWQLIVRKTLYIDLTRTKFRRPHTICERVAIGSARAGAGILAGCVYRRLDVGCRL